MFRPLRRTILATQPRPYLQHSVGSFRNYTFGNVARKNSLYKPLPMEPENIRNIEKEIGTPSKPIVPSTVIAVDKTQKQKGHGIQPEKNDTEEDSNKKNNFNESELQKMADDAFDHPIKVYF